MFKCCNKNKYGKPTREAPRYETGSIVCEGDSIVHLMNVKKCIHKDCFNIGQGGDIPDSPNMLGELPSMRRRDNISSITKAWIHAGGNYLILWGTLDTQKIYRDIEELITGYMQITEHPKNVVVSSLPFVDPKLTIKDRFKILDIDDPGNLLEEWMKNVGNVKCNEIFLAWSHGYRQVCERLGVTFFDEFTFLYLLHKAYGKKIWSDGIHWTLKTQMIIGAEIRKLLEND